jgi:hypothetical protein
MSKHQQHSKQHSKKHESKSANGKKNRWFVAAVVLMLVGMVVYVMTMEEEFRPGEEPGERAPAEAGE